MLVDLTTRKFIWAIRDLQARSTVRKSESKDISSTIMKRVIALSLRCVLVYALVLQGRPSRAQAVSPLIREYKGKAEGMIALTNNSVVPMAVVLEPRSFSITADGSGIYRPLDSGIHIKLSPMSTRIDPGQTYYVFYEAKADKLPAWFTIYSTFSAVGHGSGPDLRIVLPHTVYIYRKKAQSKEDVVEVKQAAFFRETGKIVCEIANNTVDLERVEEIRVVSNTRAISSPGFPLLPGTKRHVEVNWKEKDLPRELVLRMDRSSIKVPLSEDN
jgi:hypothetical protein